MSLSAPLILFPKVNPIKFYKDTAETPFALSTPSWQQKQPYVQPWSRLVDYLNFQVLIEADAGWDYSHVFTLEAYDINDRVYYTFPAFTAIGAGAIVRGYNYYQQSKLLNVLVAGSYQLKLNVKVWNQVTPPPVLVEDVTFWSEPFYVSDIPENTVKFKYTHDNNNHGAMFVDTDDSTQYYFYHRVKGGWPTSGYSPASSDVVYTDQEHDVVLLDSVPFETQKLQVGDGKGLPNWQIQIINHILSLSDIWIDDISYVKADGAKLEPAESEANPMRGWQVDMINAETTAENVYSNFDFNDDYNGDFKIDTP